MHEKKCPYHQTFCAIKKWHKQLIGVQDIIITCQIPQFKRSNLDIYQVQCKNELSVIHQIDKKLIKIEPCCIDCDGCGVQSGGQRDQRTESPDAKEHHHHYQSAGYCI